MSRLRQCAATLAVCAAVLAGIVLGWFETVDDALRDVRFSLDRRAATSEIVFVEIDPISMSSLGSVPWPRRVYGHLLDRLFESGATDVILEIGLHWPSTPVEDWALARTLEQAGGRARAVVYDRGRAVASAGASSVFEAPLEMFTSAADPVLVDLGRYADGKVRSYRIAATVDGQRIESLAAALNPDVAVAGDRFFIDYGILADTVPRQSVIDILSGQFDAESFSGRQVVVGVSGFGAFDGARTPIHGVMPIGMVQILAAESLRQGRGLVALGPVPMMVVVAVLGLAFGLLRRRIALVHGFVVVAVVSVAAEAAALALHVQWGLLLDTAALHFVQLGLIFAVFGHEIEKHRHWVLDAARERDSMRGTLARVVADNFDGVVVVDGGGYVRAASRLAEEIIDTGLRGRHIGNVLPAPFQEAIEQVFETGQAMEQIREVTITRGDGRPCTSEFVVTLSNGVDSVEDDGAGASGRVACLTFRDITERRQAEARLAYLARHDTLTGAASRVRFIEMASEMLASEEGRARGASVILVGLTRLKIVNDTLGHASGDALLRQVVNRLLGTDAVCVARLEGDGFGILRPGCLSDQEAARYAERLMKLIGEPYDVNGHHAIIGACVGLSDTNRSGLLPDTLVSHASMALSVASDRPGAPIATFAPEMDARIKRKQDMEVALRAALEKREFAVHYQPLVDLETGEIIGAEALARWVHPELGNVSPALFIPAAEETGLIIELGRWVLETASREVVGWPRPVRISINVSPLQFQYADVYADVQRALARSGLDPARLVIEITESFLITETSRFTQQLEKIRAIGVQVALDDFGTGYSSLSYLGRLPVDRIKIDQSFVRGLPDDAEATAIIRAVLMLSESLGKEVVAEGIESEDQAWLLRLAGCRIGQGYHFGRPCAAPDLVAMIRSQIRDAKLRA